MLDFLTFANASIRHLVLEIAIYDCHTLDTVGTPLLESTQNASDQVYVYFDSVWPWNDLHYAIQKFHQLEQLQVILLGCSECEEEDPRWFARATQVKKFQNELSKLHRQGKLLVEWRSLGSLELECCRQHTIPELPMTPL